jgi:hypothetical protein
VSLPLFLLTVAVLDVHMAEEYLTSFGPAMSRLFDISWTEQSFLLISPSLVARLHDRARQLPTFVGSDSDTLKNIVE